MSAVTAFAKDASQGFPRIHTLDHKSLLFPSCPQYSQNRGFHFSNLSGFLDPEPESLAASWDSAAASKPLFTDAEKNVIAQNIDLLFGSYFDNYLPIARGGTESTTAAGARANLYVYSKAEVDALLAGKANAGHTRSISFYSGLSGDPAHEHLVRGTKGIEGQGYRDPFFAVEFYLV